MWPAGLIASHVEHSFLNNVRPLGSLRSAERTTMPFASSGSRFEEEEILSQRPGDPEVRTTWKCIPISVYQCASVVECLSLFFRVLARRVVRG